jgi:hypothetical protein
MHFSPNSQLSEWRSVNLSGDRAVVLHQASFFSESFTVLEPGNAQISKGENKEMENRKSRANYAEFEKMVLELYDRKALTLDQLDRLASQYCLVGIDSAGSQHLWAQDGKDLHQICIETADPHFLIAAKGSGEDNEESWEQEQKKWEEIVHKRWGWQAYCRAFPIEV